ncbi:hypothetical protein C5167_033220 [Papaver somniferum]|uniref:PARP-type domain-containing protein n=1 Tax=Papaver somniferum TaxID=3469 RepID=A0A4Y7KB90_PAPSO|nr:hypothetical protein C5167_033220 [Papaver somniferum]
MIRLSQDICSRISCIGPGSLNFISEIVQNLDSAALLARNAPRWYHPTCFPTDSKSIYVDEIDGFSSLEVRKTDETIMDKGKESSSKKLKVAELEIAFSISDVQKQYKDEGLCDSVKIVAFDFDGCLANTDVRRIAQKKLNWDLLVAEQVEIWILKD